MVEPGRWESLPDVNKFKLIDGPINMWSWGNDKIFKVRSWRRGAEQKWFFTTVVMGPVRFYIGTMKLDGSRTHWYWNGWLQDPGDPPPDTNKYVVNYSNWQERWSIRFHNTPLDIDRFDNMSGI